MSTRKSWAKWRSKNRPDMVSKKKLGLPAAMPKPNRRRCAHLNTTSFNQSINYGRWHKVTKCRDCGRRWDDEGRVIE